ncbi:hypothetical protein [Roseovarius sp.]|uniref:hypothetical protein n=1 Tax=Roseovarius sp. TaxID=1486281 RepID=UPI0035688D16
MQNKIIVTSDQIEEVWTHLTREDLASQPLSSTAAERMAENGWVSYYEVCDALADMSSRISRTWFADIYEMEGRLELGGVADFRREWKYADEISGQIRLSSSDALQYFWWLERLGLPLDLGSFPDEIESRLPRTVYLSEKDIDVLLYQTERFRLPPVELVTKDAEEARVARTEVFTSPRKVVIEIHYDADNRALTLTSTAPGYEAPREQVRKTCEACGETYMQGLKGEEDRHAIEHRKVLEPLEPRPSRAWRRYVEEDPDAIWVDANSPNWMHVAITRRARAFKREFGYDFVQWSGASHANPGAVAFAFLDEECRLIGGCAFRLGGGKNGRNKLDWIWFCPSARRQGHLTRAWPRLVDRMGEFDLEPPVSEAMQAFVALMRPTEWAPRS